MENIDLPLNLIVVKEFENALYVYSFDSYNPPVGLQIFFIHTSTKRRIKNVMDYYNINQYFYQFVIVAYIQVKRKGG